MFNTFFSFLWSTKIALGLLVIISLSCAVGVLLPPAMGKEAVFTSYWFNLLLILLTVNIVSCITRRTMFLRLSQAGTTVFHLGLVLLFIGVVYDQLFFFEGAIRLTEGETLNCAERTSYDWATKGRFFEVSKLKELGSIYFHKLHIAYQEGGKERARANEIAVGEDFKTRTTHAVYVTRPFVYKGFEFFRNEKDGYSPLFVLRDKSGKLLGGSYAPLQSIRQKDGTYEYRSGSALLPGSFDFPQYPGRPPVLRLQTVYRPHKTDKRTGDVSFQVWKATPYPERADGEQQSEELFSGKAAFGERVRAGDYFLSMDEVRYWTSINVIYRPGLGVIFFSFWVTLAGLVLNIIQKTVKPIRKRDVNSAPLETAGDMVNVETRG